MRGISEKQGKIVISLSYTPKDITLKKKFGTLPVRYIRTKLNGGSGFDEKFKKLQNVVLRYRYNLLDEEFDDKGNLKSIQGPLPLPQILDDEEKEEPISKKLKYNQDTFV